MAKLNLIGKTVLITGASSGLGRLLAERFLSHGCNVVAAARRVEKLNELTKDNGRGQTLTALYLDVTDRESWKTARAELLEKGVKIDLLVNNAGVMHRFCRLFDLEKEQRDKVFETDFFGAMYGIEEFLPDINRMGAGVVNIASAAALFPIGGLGAYSSAKAALKAATESIRTEYRDMYVGLVMPGFADTELFGDSKDSIIADKDKKLVAHFYMRSEKMADKIFRRILKGKKRSVIGKDAKFLDICYRLFPLRSVSGLNAFIENRELETFSGVYEAGDEGEVQPCMVDEAGSACGQVGMVDETDASVIN